MAGTRCRYGSPQALAVLTTKEPVAWRRAAHARPFELRGRIMDGWLRVDPEGLCTKAPAQHIRKTGLGQLDCDSATELLLV